MRRCCIKALREGSYKLPELGREFSWLGFFSEFAWSQFGRSGFVLRQYLLRIEQALDAFRKALETVGFWQDIINADRGHEGFVAQDFIVHRQQDDPHRWHPCP
jgi:hypothetical protein